MHVASLLEDLSLRADAVELEQLERSDLVASGLIVELRADRTRLRVDGLRRVRAARPRLPILALVHTPSPELLDTLHALDVAICSPRLSEANLRRFVALTSDVPLGADEIRERVRQKALRKGLSRRETDLLLLATSGMPRRAIATALHVSENTVKAQIRSLLRKTGARSLAVLGQQLLRGDSAPPPAGPSGDQSKSAD